MKRRSFLKQALLAAAGMTVLSDVLARADAGDAALTKDWLARWEKAILNEARNRACDRELGEEIGWLVSPLLDGFYYGYRPTRNPVWVERLSDWADSWFRRGVKEPDGFVGWPKLGPSGAGEEAVLTDSLLGEAMGLRPIVGMAAEIRATPSLRREFGARADAWLQLAVQVFEKWDARGCWREVKEGGVWVVPPFGIDARTGRWTDGYAWRQVEGFTNPANKQNLIAQWLLALHDATGKSVYRDRAQSWFRQMKSRMRLQDSGKYFVWNYWDPAGAWDFHPDGSPRHWIGVHPNGGYYGIDVEGMTDAYAHDCVFTPDDLRRLVATNRDFMWNQRIEGAQFRRIDGAGPEEGWKDSAGTLWTALVPFDDTLRQIFLHNHTPDGWGGLGATPWYLAGAPPG